MKVVVTEFMDATALEKFGADIEVVYAPGLVDDRAALLAAVVWADAVIVRNRTRVNRELLDAAPELKVVGRLGVGLDNIDLEACAARGITVCPATGANTVSVAEYVIAVTLQLLRGAYGAQAAMISGDWPRSGLIGGEASGRVMGLLGYGGIARAVAVRARTLGMAIAAHDPFLPADDPAWEGVTRCGVEELLAVSDVLSLHVPLTEETWHMFDAARIGAMMRGAVLINTSRGGIVDEGALCAALREGQLGGAALDVFETEPLTAEAGGKFEGVPNLILTPHIAGVTEEGNIRVSTLTVANVARELRHG